MSRAKGHKIGCKCVVCQKMDSKEPSIERAVEQADVRAEVIEPFTLPDGRTIPVGTALIVRDYNNETCCYKFNWGDRAGNATVYWVKASDIKAIK